MKVNRLTLILWMMSVGVYSADLFGLLDENAKCGNEADMCLPLPGRLDCVALEAIGATTEAQATSCWEQVCENNPDCVGFWLQVATNTGAGCFGASEACENATYADGYLQYQNLYQTTGNGSCTNLDSIIVVGYYQCSGNVCSPSEIADECQKRAVRQQTGCVGFDINYDKTTYALHTGECDFSSDSPVTEQWSLSNSTGRFQNFTKPDVCGNPQSTAIQWFCECQSSDELLESVDLLAVSKVQESGDLSNGDNPSGEGETVDASLLSDDPIGAEESLGSLPCKFLDVIVICAVELFFIIFGILLMVFLRWYLKRKKSNKFLLFFAIKNIIWWIFCMSSLQDCVDFTDGKCDLSMPTVDSFVEYDTACRPAIFDDFYDTLGLFDPLMFPDTLNANQIIPLLGDFLANAEGAVTAVRRMIGSDLSLEPECAADRREEAMGFCAAIRSFPDDFNPLFEEYLEGFKNDNVTKGILDEKMYLSDVLRMLEEVKNDDFLPIERNIFGVSKESSLSSSSAPLRCIAGDVPCALAQWILTFVNTQSSNSLDEPIMMGEVFDAVADGNNYVKMFDTICSPCQWDSPCELEKKEVARCVDIVDSVELMCTRELIKYGETNSIAGAWLPGTNGYDCECQPENEV